MFLPTFLSEGKNVPEKMEVLLLVENVFCILLYWCLSGVVFFFKSIHVYAALRMWMFSCQQWLMQIVKVGFLKLTVKKLITGIGVKK